MTNRRVRSNAATAAGERVVAAAHTHDFDALADVFAEEYTEKIQDPQRPEVARADMLQGIQALLQLPAASLRMEPFATLGDDLQLHHTHITAATGDSPLTIDYFSVIRVGPDGRLLRTESFDLDRLADAIVRLYERYAESPSAPEHAGAVPAAVAGALAGAAVADVLALEPDGMVLRQEVGVALWTFHEGAIAHTERLEREDTPELLTRFDGARAAAHT